MVITTPLLQRYSRHGIESNLSFREYVDDSFHYSIQYPEHWNVFPKGEGVPNRAILYQPPIEEGGTQELVIVDFVNKYNCLDNGRFIIYKLYF